MSHLVTFLLLSLLLAARGALAETHTCPRASFRPPAPPVQGFTLEVDGEAADGVFVLPPGGQAVSRMVIVAHGRGHCVDSWYGHLQNIARHTGALAVAMNYDPVFSASTRGAQETLAAVRHFQARHPGIRETYLVSVSMGNVLASLALRAAACRRSAGQRCLFDWWIDIEGVSNLLETWTEAKAVAASNPDPESDAARAVGEIEGECGGPPALRKDCYSKRSAALQAEAIKSAVRGAIVVHAYEDGLVPYDQSRELVTNLSAAGVPVTFHSIVGRDCRLNSQGNTTLIGYSGRNPECLAGHARESLHDHVVMVTGFQALYLLMAGRHVPQGTTECNIDRPVEEQQRTDQLTLETAAIVCAGARRSTALPAATSRKTSASPFAPMR